MRVSDRIDELFLSLTGQTGALFDLKDAIRVFWPFLRNGLSLVDLAGVFAVAAPTVPASASGTAVSGDGLNPAQFPDFFRAFARLCYPQGADYCERLLDELSRIRKGTISLASPISTPSGPMSPKGPGNGTFGATKTRVGSSTPGRPNTLASDVPFLGGGIQSLWAGTFITTVADKSLLRTLLKLDLPLRRAFSAFCGYGQRLGGVVSWDEVKRLNLSLQLDGLLALCGTYSLIPQIISTDRCEQLFNALMARYPLVAGSSHASGPATGLLYPQFQLFLAMVAADRTGLDPFGRPTSASLPPVTPSPSLNVSSSVFARKSVPKMLCDALSDLLRDMGISKAAFTGSPADMVGFVPGPDASPARGFTSTHDGEGLDSSVLESLTTSFGHVSINESSRDARGLPGLGLGTVMLPNGTKAENRFGINTNHSKQAMQMRLEHQFTELERSLRQSCRDAYYSQMDHTDTPPESTNQGNSQSMDENPLWAIQQIDMLSEKDEFRMTSRRDGTGRLVSKPVVLCDAIPVPSTCPPAVEQLLEASLAHHNLGSFDESLKFLEAARIQLADIILSETGDTLPRTLQRLQASVSNENSELNASQPIIIPYLDVLMYSTLCKGNVYQSCGDDEMSLTHFLEGWKLAKMVKDLDWELVCLNSMGVLAYYNVRYEVALLCFDMVRRVRSREYGDDSADTAIALNNLSCCLFCLGLRGDARLRFEQAWDRLTFVLGHRSTRAVAVWKNLEKSKRAYAPLRSRADVAEIVELRADANKLILGGTFQIQALAPPEPTKKKKKKVIKKKR